MTQEIQKRIEQIRRGEVPEGYKKTKVGIVPADWQEHKLSHYLTVNNDKNTDLKYTKDDVFSISGELGIVNQIELLGRSYAGVSVAPYGIVYPNDVVYTKSPLKANPYGIIKTNKLGVTGIVSTLYAIFHCNNNVSPDYVQLYFESDHKLNNYLYPIVNIGAKHDMKISDEGSLRGTVVFPPLPEQEKIAAILQTEDKVIELQQKKIGELKRLKKGYLSKMFPKKGCNVPEIRFPGFTDPWEQRKVTEIGKIYIGLVTTMTKHYTDEGTLLIRNSDIKDGKFEFGDNPIYLEKTFAEKNETRMHQIGDVITVHTGDVGTSAVITENEAKSIGFATIVTRPNPKIIDSNYLCSFLNTDKHKKWAVSISTGDGRTNYNLGDYFELVVPVPSIAEQKKIASYIQKLNRLITLHQRKCDEEKQKKKALMQLLLTGIVRVKYDT